MAGYNYYNPYNPPYTGYIPNTAVGSPSYTPPSLPAPQPPNQGIIWVQGEAGAKSYLVGAGQSVLLMDSENPIMYIKSTDASGMPLPLRIFDYSERTQQISEPAGVTGVDMTKYVTHDELKKWANDLKTSILKGDRDGRKSTV